MVEKSSNNNSPLTPAVFYILLSLSDSEKHGYGIMKDVAYITEGEVDMGPGTLYSNLKRMLNLGFIEELETVESNDKRKRRTYKISGHGKKVLQAETGRLARLLEIARRKNVFLGVFS